MLQLGKIKVLDRRETLADKVYIKIRKALMDGTLSPGQKITIRDVAMAVDVSLTPAREAIGRLAAEKVLDVGPTRNVTVPNLTKEKYTEIIKIRIFLESMAAEKAISKLTGANIENMKKLHKKHLEAIIREDYKTVLQLNEEFHFCIYSASSALLVSIIETLWLQIGPTFNLLYPKYAAGRQGNKNHKMMLDAILKHDAIALKKAIVKDIKDAEEHLKPLLIK